MSSVRPEELSSVGTDPAQWRERAACRGVSPDEFYGAGAQHGGGLTWCRRCPVSRPCLWQGIAEEVETGYAYGIRGGMSAPQRTELAQDMTPAVIAQHLAEALVGSDPGSARAVA